MRGFFVCLVLLLGVQGGSAQPAPPPTATLLHQLTLTQPWTVRRGALAVLAPAGSAEKSGLRRVDVHYAAYSYPGPRTSRCSVVALTDPLSKRICFVRWGYASDFFVADHTGVWAVGQTAGWTEQIICVRQFFSAPAQYSRPDAIVSLEKTFNWADYDDLSRADSFRITLIPAAPAGFFGDARGLSEAPGPPLEEGPIFNGVGAVEGGTIRLDYYSPELKMPASFWIDFAARKVVRGVVGGHEMKLGADGAPGTAVDGTNLVTPAMRAWAEAFRTGKKEEPAAPPAPQTTPSP